MLEFYERCFGMERIAADDGYYGLRSSGWTLWLLRGRRKVEGGGVVADEAPARRSDVPVKLCLSVQSIEAVRSSIAELGGAVDPDEWDFAGFRRCDAVDPEGNVIQLLELLSST
jgi:predicted enzyme related to lactoylglutathione lyase